MPEALPDFGEDVPAAEVPRARCEHTRLAVPSGPSQPVSHLGLPNTVVMAIFLTPESATVEAVPVACWRQQWPRDFH